MHIVVLVRRYLNDVYLCASIYFQKIIIYDLHKVHHLDVGTIKLFLPKPIKKLGN